MLYDPQGPSLHSPEQPETPRDPAAEAWQAAKAGTVGALLIAAGWWIPYKLLGWPLMIVGAFLVVMTIYTFVVLIKPEWQQQ